MQKKSFQIKGATDYVFSKFIPDSKVPKTDEAMTKSAMEQVYSTEKGELFIPARQIKGAMKTAINLADMKIAKSKLKAIKFIEQIVFVEPVEIPMMHGKKRLTTKDIFLFDSPTTVGSGGKQQMIMKRRAAVKAGYTLSFGVVILAENILDMSFIEAVIKNASILASIGAMRNHGYGKVETVA